MRLQEAPHLCGPTALSNALLALGRDIAPAACATLCRTTTAGTGDAELERAITDLGFSPIIVRTWFELRGALNYGAPVVCSVQESEPYDHWVAAIGTIGDLIIVADSLDYALVKTFARADWMATWTEGEDGRYGVALT